MPWRRSKTFPSYSASRIMAVLFRRRPAPRLPELSPCQANCRQTNCACRSFTSPPGLDARNQVAGMIEAGTPLVGGVALGRGGADMDGLPLYDRIAELPQQ